MGAPRDPEIEAIEAELRESRFKAWDAETFLANRHRAKIEALTAPDNKWRQRWQVTKECAVIIAAFVGYITLATAGGMWAITGEFSLFPGKLRAPAPIIMVPPAPTACPNNPLP